MTLSILQEFVANMFVLFSAWGRYYNTNFLRFLPIFGENFVFSAHLNPWPVLDADDEGVGVAGHREARKRQKPFFNKNKKGVSQLCKGWALVLRM
jgi:hypothetical protein